MSGRIKPIIKKEFRQIARDPRTLGLLLLVPAVLLVLYGYALNFDVKHIPLGVLDEDRSASSRDLAGTFTRTEYFDPAARLLTRAEVDRLLGEGRIKAALIIPRGFADAPAAGETAEVQVLLDGSDAQSATTAAGYVQAIVQDFSTRILVKALSRKGMIDRAIPLTLEPRIWYNQELLSVRFLVPGLIAFILMVIVVISTSFAVVREKERGTMEQILVSPVKPHELIIGKTVPYMLISLVSSHLVLFFGRILFGVGIRGSYPWLLAVIILFLLCALSFGLLISTVAKTQQAAFMPAILTTLLPTFILSGFIFPLRNMPAVIRAVSVVVPSRYFLSALRSIILRGAGPAAFWDQFVGLAAFTAAAMAAAVIRLRRERRRGEG